MNRSLRWIAAVLLVVSAGACKTLVPDKDNLADRLTRTGDSEMPRMGEKKTPAEEADPTAGLEDFLSALREAVAGRDMAAIASMMTPDFGYRLDPPLEGDGVFRYWDENALWQELGLVISEPFLPIGGFHVAPPAFVEQGSAYTGYRAGVKKIGGRWRFVYFVNG